MALPIVKEYIKNLAKSVGYAAVDTTKMQAPAFKDFLETNEELFSDVYHGIRDITGTIDKAQKIVMESQIYKTGDLALHNAWEDIKTGKIYNKERENAAEDAAVDNMMGSDLDFGGTEFNDETGEYEPKKSKKEDIPVGDKAVISAVDSAMKASTIATGTAIASTGKYIATTNKAIANMQLAAQGKMVNLMSSGFGAITSGFQSLHSTMSEGLKVQTDNQKTYFETTTKLLQEQNAMMKEMLEMQRGIYKKEAKKDKEGKGNTYEDVVTASGVPNLKAYGNAIWTNFKDIIDEQTGGMGSMLNEDMLKALAANPLGGIAEFVVAGLMGNALKTNLKNFDKTLSSTFGNLISRFNYEGSKDDNGITGFISKVFGLKSSIKSSIRTDQYEKGSVPWSGKDSMSLQVVIPSYLSRIESALTGKKARLFDYDKGVFTLKDDAEKRFTSQRKQYARSATSDVRGDVEKQLSVFGFNYETQKKLKEYLDNAFEQIYSDFGQFNTHDKTLVSRYRGNFNGDEELTKLFIKAMENVDREKRMQMAPEVMSQRQAQDQMMKRMEKEGTNAFINLYREFAAQNGADPELKLWGKGSYKEGRIKDKISSISEGRLDKVTDVYKKTVFDYLRDISLTLRNIRELNAAGFAYGGGSGGGDTLDESNITINNMTKADIFAMPTDNKAQRMRRTRFISMYNRRVAQVKASQAASSSGDSDAFWNTYNRDNSERMMGDKRRKTPTQENMDYENSQRAANNRRVEEKLRSGEFKLKFNGDNLGQAQGILDTMRKIKDAKNEAELNTQYNELAKILHTRADRAKELAETLMGVKEGEQVEVDENGKPVKRKKEIGGFKVNEGGIVDKLMTAGGVMEKVKVIQDELAALVTRPTDALAGVIAKADEHVYDFFFSKDANETDDQGNRITGMFGYMKNEMKKEFKHFNDWIDKEILQKLKDKFGGETAWEAAGNAIEKYTGFNPYKGAMNLKDKIIGAKGEDGQREGGFLSNFLNKINDDVQNTLLNLKESVEEKMAVPKEEEDITPSAAPSTAPLTMKEIQDQHWSRSGDRVKREYKEARNQYNASKKELDNLGSKKASDIQARIQRLYEIGGESAIGHGLNARSNIERVQDIDNQFTNLSKMIANRKSRGEISDKVKIVTDQLISDIKLILGYDGSYPNPNDPTKEISNVEYAEWKIDKAVNNNSIDKSLGEVLKRMLIKSFSKTQRLVLSDEEKANMDTKYDEIQRTMEASLQTLRENMDKKKSRYRSFQEENAQLYLSRRAEREFNRQNDINRDKAARISELYDMLRSGEITSEQYAIFRRNLESANVGGVTTQSAYAKRQEAEARRNTANTIKTSRENLGNSEINNLVLDSRIGSREDISKLTASGQFATGGVVPKTGLYILSKDEQVIPTTHMEEDAARENALIAKLRKQYPNFNFEGQYAYGTGSPQPVFSDETLKEHRYKEGKDGWWYNDLSQTYTKNINGRQFLREESTRNDLDSNNTERFQEIRGADGVTRLIDKETKETFINIDGKWMRESEITKASQLKKGSTGNIIGSLTRTGFGGAFNWITDKIKYNPEKDGENKPMSRQAMDTLRDGFNAVTENFLYGSDPKKTKEQLEQVKKETINAMPYAVSGGLMGLVPGLVMGAPFFGALVGAGLNVVNKSDTMSDWLFGARDENGERKDDGFISKDTQTMLKKYMPDMKLFGSIGSIAGLITGLGPIPGLMIGGAAAFVKNNEEASNVLFGDDGLIGPHAKEKLKKAAPHIFAGAGSGALFGLLGGSLPVFGPLGLLGGLAAGAGLGLLSTTDSFKDAILGPKDKEGKRHGGLVGSIRDAITDPIKGLGNKISGAFTRYIKEDLIGPVARSVAPFTKVLQLGANKMFSAIGSAFSVAINKVFAPAKDLMSSAFQWLFQRTPLGRWAGKLGGGLKNGIAGLFSAPSKLIGMAGDWTRQKLIQSGNAGDFMSSDEQLSFMNDRGIDSYKYKEMNQKLAGMNSMELERQLGNIDMMLDSNRNIEDERKKESSRFNSEIKANHHILPIERKKLIKLVKDGKIEEANEYVMGLRLPQNEKRSIIESIEGHTNRMSDIDNFGDSSAQTEDMYAKLTEAFGFKVNESNIHKLRAQLKTDIKSAKTDEEEMDVGSEELKAQLDSNSELRMQTDLLTEIRDRLDALRGVQSGDFSKLKPSQKMAYDMQRDSSAWYRNSYNESVDVNASVINKSVMDAFTKGRNLSDEERAKYVVSDTNKDVLADNSRNPNSPDKVKRISRLGEVNKLNLTPGQINLLIGTPDKEFKALIKTFELGFNLKEDDIVAILKCNRQIGGDRASTNLNILLENDVPIYRLTDDNGDTQKFLAVRKEVLDNMIRIRDEYLPSADAEALYEVYARHKSGLLSDAETYADVDKILDRELGENFRKGMERRSRDASVGRGEKGDQERGGNTVGSASKLFNVVHGIDTVGRAVHGADITGSIANAYNGIAGAYNDIANFTNRPITVGSHAFGGIAKAGLNILSKGERLVSTAKSGIDAVRDSSVFKGAKSVASGIYKAGKFVKNMVSDPTGAAIEAATSGYSALKKSLENKAGENGEEGENKGEKIVNTDYGPMIYKKSMSGDYTLANTKDNVNIKNAIANRDNTQSNILSVLEEIRNNTKGGTSSTGNEKSSGGMGLLGMLGALASGIKKIFSTSLKIGKGIYKGVRGIFKLGKVFGKTAIRFFGKLLAKIGMTSIGGKLGGFGVKVGGAGGGGKRRRGTAKGKAKRRTGKARRRRTRFGRGAYGLGSPMLAFGKMNTAIGSGMDLFNIANESFDDDFDDVDIGDFSDEGDGDFGFGDEGDDFEDFADEADGIGMEDALDVAEDVSDIMDLRGDRDKKNHANKKTPNTPEPNKKPGLFESAKQKIQAGVDWGMDKIRSAGQSIKDAASSAWGAVKNSSVGKAVGGFATQIKNQIVDKMKSIANFIVDKAPKVSGDKMKSFFDKILAKATKPEKLAKIAEKAAIKAGFSSAEAAAGAGTFGIGAAVLATAEIAFWFSQGAMKADENFELKDGEEPTAGMRFISGVAEAICGCTPIGYVLEGSDIISIAKETLGDIIGDSKSSKDLDKAVKSAQSEQGRMAAGNQNDYLKPENSSAASSSSSEGGDWFSSMKSTIANSYVGQKAASAASWVKDKASSVASGVKSFFGFGKFGPSYGMGGFYSQLDPSVANIPFNVSGDTQKQTIGDSACGPAALMNVASALGKDKFGRGSGDLAKASMDALAYKEKDGGTKPGYFNAEANKLGFSTKKVPVSSVDSELDKGHPVIMMGQDPSVGMGMGKYGMGNPVYGPYPHYIAVTGKDDQGNYIVQDSEGSPNQRVSGKYLKEHSSLAMAGMGKWGRGPAIDEDPPFGSIAATIAKSVGSQHPELFWAQMMFETGGPERARADMQKTINTIGSDDFNYGGFTWYPGMGEDYKGMPRPSNEGGYYAKFKSDAEYADMAYNKVYKSYKDSIAKAENADDFARILKENGYYASDESEYAAGLKAHLNGQYKDKLSKLGGMAGQASSSSGGSNSGGKNYSGFFGGLQRIYDAFASVFSLGSSGGTSGSSGASSGGSGTATTGQITGDGNTMHIDAQTGGNCTIEATRAMVKAYLDRDEPKRNEQFSWWNPTLEGDLQGKWVNFGNSAADKTNFENYIANHFASKPGNPIFLYQTGGAGRNGGHPINAGQGDHASVIGRKLSNGKYEHYDSAGGVVKEFDLGDIFDSTAQGGSQGMEQGQGNSIVVPGIDPSRPIANWEGSTPTAEPSGKGKWGRGKEAFVTFKDMIGQKLNKGLDGNAKEFDGIQRDVKGEKKVFAQKFGKGKWGRGTAGEEIYKGLMARGFTDVASAGILGNIMQESSLDPTATNPSGYHGLVQWDPNSRWPAAKEWISSHGKDPDSIDGQLDYISVESEQRYDSKNKVNATTTPEEATKSWLRWFEGATGQEDSQRVSYANQAYASKGKDMGGNVADGAGGDGSGASGGGGQQNNKSSGFSFLDKIAGAAEQISGKLKAQLSAAFGNVKIPESFKKAYSSIFGGNFDLLGSLFGGTASASSGGSGGGAVGATSEGIKGASQWAESVLNKAQDGVNPPYWYGSSGCTAFVKAYLEKAGIKHPDFDMYVPTLYNNAKAHGTLKGPDQPGAEGDVAIVRDDGSGEPCHVVIADGKGGYWGNSSGRHMIVHSNSITGDYNKLWGYLPTGSGSGTVSNDKLTRSNEEQHADAGPTDGMGKWGRGELLNRLRTTGSLFSGTDRAQELYKMHKSYDFSDVNGVDPDGNKYSIPYLVKKYNLQFDEYGNLLGVDIPEYNRINGTEDDTVKYAKQRAQIQYYAKNVYGNKGKEELSTKLESTGSLLPSVSGIDKAQEPNTKTYDFSDVSGVAPDGNKYSIPYLVKKYNLQFDEYGNLKGVNIPEYNRINGTEDDTVKYAKQRAQIQYYAKDVYGKGKWGRGELLNRLRATGSLFTGTDRAQELYKRHKSYDFSDVTGVDPDGNKYSIPYLVKKYNLQFDEYGNLKGVDIPEYNRINGTEDDTVKYAKQRAQIQYYAKDVYGNKGNEELSTKLSSTGSLSTGEPVSGTQESETNKTYDFSDVSGVAPDGNKYSIPYLVKKYNLQFDEYGNLLGVNIPEYNRINGTEDNTVKYAKQRAQIQYYAKDVYGTGKWGRGELLNRLRTTGSLFSGTDRAQELYKMHKSYDFSDVSGVDPDGNKYSIPYLVKKYNLQFDEYGNLKGVDIPEYNRINGTESDTVKYAKQRAQIEYYAKDVYGNKGNEELSTKLSSTGSLSTGESVSGTQEPNTKTYDFSDVSGVAPDGNKYSIPYLVKKYNLQFDGYGNLLGVDIPEYNRINGTEDDTVKYAKQRAQIQYYAKNAYGKGKWGRGVELDSKYLNENIPSYNKIDLKNDSMTVINAKKKAIDAWYAAQNNNPLHDAQLEKAKDEASGGNNIKLSSNDDRATLRKKTFFNKMMNEIPSYNKIDSNNTSNNFSALHDKIVSSVSGRNVQPTTDPNIVSKSKTLPGTATTSTPTTTNAVPNYNNTTTSFSSLHDKIVAAMSRRNANSSSKYGTGKFGGLLGYINDKILGTAKDFVFGKEQKPLDEKISPSETPKTETTINGEELPLAPNGMPFEQNDIDYLVNNGYSKEDALKLLATDKKYTTKPEDKTASSEAAIKEAEEKAKREREEYEAKQPGMSKMFGWDSHKKLDRYYEEKDKIARAKSNVEKLREEQAKAEEIKAQQEQAQKATEIKTKEAEAKAEQANVAAASTSGDSYQEKIISLLTAAVQYLSVIAGNGGGANPSAVAQQQNMAKMKSDLKDIINGTSNIGGISDLVGGSDMSSIMKTLNLVATR